MFKIFTKLKEQALYVKKSKSRFKTQKVKFLEYVIWSEHIKKDSEKTVAVRNWLTQKNQKSLSFSRISELLLKVCIQLLKNSWISSHTELFLLASLEFCAHALDMSQDFLSISVYHLGMWSQNYWVIFSMCH